VIASYASIENKSRIESWPVNDFEPQSDMVYESKREAEVPFPSQLQEQTAGCKSCQRIVAEARNNVKNFSQKRLSFLSTPWWSMS
jgi:hypothetical protein